MNEDWVDATLYPFERRYVEVDAGRLHYIDEGVGEPIVFVHGTPTWSFLWRHLVRDLSTGYRCIALDHLGFGLSDKPATGPYTPADHARNFEAFIERLGLDDVTLVVHDFGGPIALPFALRHRAHVERVVLMNTWLWSNQGDRAVESASRILGGPIGRFLYRRLNFSPRVLLEHAFADKSKLSGDVHRHYLAPFPTPAERHAPWVLARELAASNDWYDAAWQRRDALSDVPMLILWGLRDPLLPQAHLTRWREAFPHAQAVPLDGVGHFVAEEAPAVAGERIRRFLDATDGSSIGPRVTSSHPPPTNP